ncbi:hypothetical protein L484_009201 [Morus notabilis]|uniref:Uncharacterized protein n=1 Tax=Morus notabilis TaxID=981085 RepID=W9SGH9_9ROSA|nr:hypothetical protein L484_009201 [Morus notabilis]
MGVTCEENVLAHWGFMYRMLTSYFPGQVEVAIETLANAVTVFFHQADSRHTFFVPFNRGSHWMLTMVSPLQDRVVRLDSLRKKPCPDFKRMIAL